MELINRKKYTDRVKQYFGKGLIVILTGQRRIGKSCVMRSVIEEYSQNPENNIISINKESEEFNFIKIHDELSDYVLSRLAPDKHNYLFIDEVQEISGFEKALRSFIVNEQCEVVATGSNAQILSGELATLLSGRYVEIHVAGLDYSEFLQFHKLQNNDDSLRKFLLFGGLPHLHRLGLNNTDMVDEYIQNVRNSIMLKDVVARERVSNITILENLMSFLGDSSGKLVSASSLSNVLKANGFNISSATVLNYMHFFCNAHIMNKVPRYDIKGKKILESNEKYYFEDLGIRNSLQGSKKFPDVEKLMETAVYLHLVNCGFRVYVGVLYKTEIDFVAERNGERIYVQVTYLLQCEDTIKREFGNLELINDNYPKYVISWDPFYQSSNNNGVLHINLRDFLSNDL